MLARRSNAGSALLITHRVFTKAAKASSSHCSIEQVKTAQIRSDGVTFISAKIVGRDLHRYAV